MFELQKHQTVPILTLSFIKMYVSVVKRFNTTVYPCSCFYLSFADFISISRSVFFVYFREANFFIIVPPRMVLVQRHFVLICLDVRGRIRSAVPARLSTVVITFLHTGHQIVLDSNLFFEWMMLFIYCFSVGLGFVKHFVLLCLFCNLNIKNNTAH